MYIYIYMYIYMCHMYTHSFKQIQIEVHRGSIKELACTKVLRPRWSVLHLSVSWARAHNLDMLRSFKGWMLGSLKGLVTSLCSKGGPLAQSIGTGCDLYVLRWDGMANKHCTAD